jgi:hypothetical protein
MQCDGMACLCWPAPPLASSLKAVSIPSPSCVPGVSCLVSEFHPHSLLLLPDVPYVRALMGKHPSATGAPCGRRLPMSLAAFSSCRSIWYVSGLLFSPLALLVDLGSLPDPPMTKRTTRQRPLCTRVHSARSSLQSIPTALNKPRIPRCCR